MKNAILLILLMSFTLLFAQTGFPTVRINPSSTSLALGNVTGVANVWSGDPLNVWSNPALVAFHDGIRISGTRYKWLQGLDWGDLTMYNNVSYASFAKNGWGISVPMLNSEMNLGSTFDHGVYTYAGNKPDHSFDTSSELSIAYNPFMRLKKDNDSPFVQSFDASLGFSFNFLSSFWEQYTIDEYHPGTITLQTITAYASPLNAGALLKLDGAKLLGFKKVNIEASFGWEGTNVIDTKIKYSNAETPSRIPVDHRLGGGLFIGMPMSLVSPTETAVSRYFPHLVTILLMQGSVTSKFDQDEQGQGIEIGLLDTFFIRKGSHHVEGIYNLETTQGVGLKLHAGKWAMQGNYAEYWQGDLKQKTWDAVLAYSL